MIGKMHAKGKGMVWNLTDNVDQWISVEWISRYGWDLQRNKIKKRERKKQREEEA
jgi:hypothetical protein